MTPTRITRIIKGNPVLFLTDIGTMTALELLPMSNAARADTLIRRAKKHGANISMILHGESRKEERKPVTVTSICQVCGDEFQHPSTERRVCCSKACAARTSSEEEVGTPEWIALGNRVRNYNLAKIRTGSLERSVYV